MFRVRCTPCRLEVRAARQIDAGEELTIAYIDVGMPLHSRRQKLLFSYGFKCECSACLSEDSKTP